jgi:hypothetical protein
MLVEGLVVVAGAEAAAVHGRIACVVVPVTFHSWMQRQQRITVELAVQILRSAMMAGRQIEEADAPVRLALRCLWPHCPERWPLVQFWEGGQGSHDIGRSQSMTASFNGIVRQLRRSGAWTDEPLPAVEGSA